MNIRQQIELAGKQMHFLLDDCVEIAHPTRTRDGLGGSTTTNTVQTVKGLWETLSPNEAARVVGAAETYRQIARVSVPLSTTVDIGDRATNTRLGQSGEVVGIPRDTYEALRVFYVAVVK